jgi:integrase/recombinase XerC
VVSGRSDPPEGSAHLELIQDITLLHPEDAVLEAMLTGWSHQQLGGRKLARRTVTNRLNVVRRFADYTNEYPWNWTAAQVDEWMTHLVTELRQAPATLRGTQSALRMFCDFLVDPRYGWVEECEGRFGTHPVQVCHEWNTLAHVVDYEGDPRRRPISREELQRFFDYIDSRVDHAIQRRRKGALTAYRDGALFKTIYGWGLRATEASRLDLVDFHRNPKAPEFGRFGILQVRYGKRSRGSAPRRRGVASVMPWAVEVLKDYVVNIRPRFGHPDHPAVWLTERGGRIQPREIDERFAIYRDALKLPKELTPHCLRHSYVTHQIEDGTSEKFVQQQVGHLYASTLAIYTAVSDDFANTMMRKAIDRAIAQDEDHDRQGHAGRTKGSA